MHSKESYKVRSPFSSCYFKANNIVKYFFPSPTTIQLFTKFICSLTWVSIKIGATFSPPAVINNSLILPVIDKFPLLSNFPTSPECKYPSASIVSLVASSFF